MKPVLNTPRDANPINHNLSSSSNPSQAKVTGSLATFQSKSQSQVAGKLSSPPLSCRTPSCDEERSRPMRVHVPHRSSRGRLRMFLAKAIAPTGSKFKAVSSRLANSTCEQNVPPLSTSILQLPIFAVPVTLTRVPRPERRKCFVYGIYYGGQAMT